MKPEQIKEQRDKMIFDHLKPYIKELTRESFTFTDLFQFLREQSIRDHLHDFNVSKFRNQNELDKVRGEAKRKAKKR